MGRRNWKEGDDEIIQRPVIELVSSMDHGLEPSGTLQGATQNSSELATHRTIYLLTGAEELFTGSVCLLVKGCPLAYGILRWMVCTCMNVSRVSPAKESQRPQQREQ